MDQTLVNEHIRWGVVVVTYLFLSGVGAGSLIVAALPRLPWLVDRPALLRLRRAALISAAACFVVIPLAVVADLTQPWRMWRVLFAPHLTSAMPYGSAVLVVLSGLIAIDLWLVHRPGFARVAAERDDLVGRVAGRLAGRNQEPDGPLPPRAEALSRVVTLASVVAAVAFVAYTGFLLSSMSSFGLWYTPLLGIVFALAALAAGFCWMAVLAGFTRELSGDVGLVRLLAGTGAAFLAAHLASRFWWLLHTAYGENPLWPAIRELHFSRDAVAFVGIEVVVGGLVAIVLLAWAARRGRPGLAVAGGLLGLAGLYASRWMIVIGGQTISRTGRGFVDEAVPITGREGVLAASGLILWAFVVGFLLWVVLPHDRGPATEDTPAPGSRRQVLVAGAAAVAAVAAGWSTIRALFRPEYRRQVVGPAPPTADAVVHTVCLSCDARCGSRAVIRDGKVRNLLGNPYHPASTMNEPIAYDTPIPDALRESGSLCLKGVSGIQYLYDPYRIRLPLKRTGPRGSGSFEPIAWDQLVEEVVEGGRLFEHLGEDREIEGLRALRSTEPLDPDAPELGPVANQVVWNTGRGQPGRQEFIERFLGAYGSINYVSHTDLCQMNWYVANYLFTGRYYDEEVEGHSQLFGDIVNSEYMIFFGVNLGGGWKPGVNTSAPILANRHARGDGHLVLVDPYVPPGRGYADEWVPVTPGTDAALAMGMIRWILDHDRHNAEFLGWANEAAARARGETAWINAPYLVIADDADPRTGRFLRPGDLGLDGADDAYVVIDPATGRPVPNTAVDTGELFVDQELDAIDGPVAVKTALQLLRDEADRESVAGWAEIAGVPAATVERLADEFTSHGRAATASFYRGPVMHSMGIYAGLAIHMLNAMVGNLDRRGGMMKNPSEPDWEEGTYDLATVDGAPETGGVHISRVGTKSDVPYEESTEYARKVEAGQDPYPSDRPWYPFTHAGITTEALAAIVTGYPYPPKIWFSYFINPRHSIPGGLTFADALGDPERLPLFVAVDTTISETSVFADYIVPDAMYLDGQYGFMGQGVGACSAVHVGIRTPAVAPLTGRTDDGRPMLLETFLIDLADRLDLPGYGDDAIPGAGPRAGRSFPLHRAEDYYLRGIANLAANVDAAPADAEEQRWVEAGYPVAEQRDLLDPDEWSQAARLIARGGWFEAPDTAWDDQGRHTAGLELDALAPLQVWHETLATTVNPALGRTLPGCATFVPAEDGTGQVLDDLDADYPFRVVTFRLSTRTKARTAYDYWALEIHPRNHLEMNPEDARRLGLATGDRVSVSSPSGAVEATLLESERVRPGVVAGTHHFGHTQQGTSDWAIRRAEESIMGARSASPVLHGMSGSPADGDRVHGDDRRGADGFNVNDAMRRNDDLDGTPLVDNAGGATVFLDTRVRVEAV